MRVIADIAAVACAAGPFSGVRVADDRQAVTFTSSVVAGDTRRYQLRAAPVELAQPPRARAHVDDATARTAAELFALLHRHLPQLMFRLPFDPADADVVHRRAAAAPVGHRRLT